MKKFLMIAALVAAPAAMADLSYQYFDVSYSRMEDVTGFSSNEPGLFLSKSLADQVQFRFGYSTFDVADFITFGLGYNKPISDATDFVLTVDTVRVSVPGAELPYTNLGLGVRSAVSDSVELEGSVIYGVGLFGNDAASDTFGVAAGARFNFSEQMALGFGYKTFDDIDSMSLSFRFNF